jgi:hypothetical protein
MTRRTAAVVALASAAGLLVSMISIVAWSGRQVPDADRVAAAGSATTADSARLPPAAPAPAKAQVTPPAGRRPTIPTSSAALSRRTAVRVAAPVEVAVPSVGLRAPVRPVGVTPDGLMELPPDPTVMGWYRFGAAPSTSTGGSVVVAGHLDSARFGVGPLVRLRDVELGARVTLVTSGGARLHYAVRRVQRFDRQQLPDEVFGRSGPELLRLVTCGGAYDPESGYQENLVVTAAPVR